MLPPQKPTCYLSTDRFSSGHRPCMARITDKGVASGNTHDLHLPLSASWNWLRAAITAAAFFSSGLLRFRPDLVTFLCYRCSARRTARAAWSCPSLPRCTEVPQAVHPAAPHWKQEIAGGRAQHTGTWEPRIHVMPSFISDPDRLCANAPPYLFPLPIT